MVALAERLHHVASERRELLAAAGPTSYGEALAGMQARMASLEAATANTEAHLALRTRQKEQGLVLRGG